jgi:hypothetical protein
MVASGRLSCVHLDGMAGDCLKSENQDGAGKSHRAGQKPHALHSAIGLRFQLEYHWRGVCDTERWGRSTLYESMTLPKSEPTIIRL